MFFLVNKKEKRQKEMYKKIYNYIFHDSFLDNNYHKST